VRPERHGLADEVADRSRRAVGPHYEHPRTRIHGGEDSQRRARPADASERLVGGLAGDQRDVELSRFEQRDVLAAPLGVAWLDVERGLDRVDHLGDDAAVERKAAARGGGTEDDARLLLSHDRINHRDRERRREHQFGYPHDTPNRVARTGRARGTSQRAGASWIWQSL
jgi:hypothetical protein